VGELDVGRSEGEFGALDGFCVGFAVGCVGLLVDFIEGHAVGVCVGEKVISPPVQLTLT
jgi:hypothetical protein